MTITVSVTIAVAVFTPREGPAINRGFDGPAVRNDEKLLVVGRVPISVSLFDFGISLRKQFFKCFFVALAVFVQRLVCVGMLGVGVASVVIDADGDGVTGVVDFFVIYAASVGDSLGIDVVDFQTSAAFNFFIWMMTAVLVTFDNGIALFGGESEKGEREGDFEE